MDSLLGRSQFHSETANLFTDEKTANARNKVIEWLNELISSESNVKVSLLIKVQEIILNSFVELLEEFLEPILAMAQDSNMEVRKQVVCFIEQMCKIKVEMLPQVINIISLLLRDRSPQVIKRVIQACGSLYRNGIQWICSQKELTDSMEQAWNVLSLVKAQILDLIDNDNDGIRTNVIKFLEGVVVLQTYSDEDSQKKDNDFSLLDVPETLKLIKRQKLEEESLNIFEILLQFHGATHISSVNLIACTSSLCTIAKLRPTYMEPVIDAFKSLNANLPPTLTDSQVSSVRKSLKMQLIGLLKNKGSYEYQGTIRNLLLDLGASNGEIQRSTPKMDKQELLRRQKRILEQGNNSQPFKRKRFGDIDISDDINNSNNSFRINDQFVEMEEDKDEIERQRQKSLRVNEKFLAERLRSTNLVTDLIIEFLHEIPNRVPPHFLTDYTPIQDMSIQQLVLNISKVFAEQLTEQRVGPGAAAFSKDKPMRPVRNISNNASNENLSSEQTIEPMDIDEDEIRKEEATKKLRENMERIRGEQELIERMKQRVKTLKLQEVTKPINRTMKDQFLMDAVKRILQSERNCIAGGVSAKRRKILTVLAATFPTNIRACILEFILKDISKRIDLAFSWLYEEYCLLQGFTRHSYVKSETRPDYAYNELLGQLIDGIIKNCEYKDKIVLLRRVYLEMPLLPDAALKYLAELCMQDDYMTHCFDLMRDLAIIRLPRRNKLVNMLLTFCLHNSMEIRERAIEHIVNLYHVQKILPNRIEDFAIEWSKYVMKESPPVKLFSAEFGRTKVEQIWNEHTVKLCLIVLLGLLPINPELGLKHLFEICTNATPEVKRIILRSIDMSIKKLGPDNPVLHKVIADCTKGTETIIIRIVHILTERVKTPNAELVRLIRELYASKVNDVRVLIPVLGGLSRQEIINALPKLIKLNHIVVKEVLNRLLCIGSEYSQQSMSTTPTDILIALHSIDTSVCDLKCIVKATSLCLIEKDVFTHDVLIGALQKLVEVVPIPTLLMRTIIQSLTIYPRLSNFIVSLLQRLILKQVWRNKVIWEGFLKCCQRLKPHSMPVLLQLPVQQLSNVLQQCPDLREPLKQYAESVQDEPMSGITSQIMDIITGKVVDVFITDESGGYITVDNIKQENEDQNEFSNITTLRTLKTTLPSTVSQTENAQSEALLESSSAISDVNQPLPPGEE